MAARALIYAKMNRMPKLTARVRMGFDSIQLDDEFLRPGTSHTVILQFEPANTYLPQRSEIVKEIE
jgi:hypothetical protein